MDINGVLKTASDIIVTLGFKVIGALVLFWIGRRLIDLAVRLLESRSISS